jgi:hypothetical protein
MAEEESQLCLLCGRKSGCGLMIRGKCICKDCEEVLLRLPVADAAYDYCKNRLKLLWAEG